MLLVEVTVLLLQQLLVLLHGRADRAETKRAKERTVKIKRIRALWDTLRRTADTDFIFFGRKIKQEFLRFD